MRQSILVQPPVRFFGHSARSLAAAPAALLKLPSLETEEHHRLAREWTSDFVVDDIPKQAYDITYARSSGPGGQVGVFSDGHDFVQRITLLRIRAET